jgi:hypothetical protein
VGAIGALSASPRVHAALAVVCVALPVVAAATVLLRPGSLASLAHAH